MQLSSICERNTFKIYMISCKNRLAAKRIEIYFGIPYHCIIHHINIVQLKKKLIKFVYNKDEISV